MHDGVFDCADAVALNPRDHTVRGAPVFIAVIGKWGYQLVLTRCAAGSARHYRGYGATVLGPFAEHAEAEQALEDHLRHEAARERARHEAFMRTEEKAWRERMKRRTEFIVEASRAGEERRIAMREEAAKERAKATAAHKAAHRGRRTR